jgi:hypothetical protein
MFKILRKDLLAYWMFIMLGFTAQLTLSTVMIIYGRDDSWRPFIFIGCVQIATIILFFLLYEKIKGFDNIIFSMPLTRRTVINARYTGSIIIAIFGLILHYSVASYIYANFDTVPTDFRLYESFRTVSVIAIFFSFFISIFVPLTIRIKQFIILIVPLIIIAYLYVKAAEKLKFYGDLEFNLMSILFMLVMLILPLVISYFTSLKFINDMDLA